MTFSPSLFGCAPQFSVIFQSCGTENISQQHIKFHHKLKTKFTWDWIFLTLSFDFSSPPRMVATFFFAVWRWIGKREKSAFFKRLTRVAGINDEIATLTYFFRKGKSSVLHWKVLSWLFVGNRMLDDCQGHRDTSGFVTRQLFTHSCFLYFILRVTGDYTHYASNQYCAWHWHLMALLVIRKLVWISIIYQANLFTCKHTLVDSFCKQTKILR